MFVRKGGQCVARFTAGESAVLQQVLAAKRSRRNLATSGDGGVGSLERFQWGGPPGERY